MVQDEFNQNNFTNDKQLLKAEFGKTQSNEFSDGGEMHLHRSAYNANLNQTVKNSQETFVEAEATTGASTVGGGTVTTIGGSTSASTIAAGSVSAVVVASSVTITAISVVTGVSVAMHDYQCDVKALFVSSNQITYELNIQDLRQEDNDYDYELETYDEQPCSIRVYNKYYDKTNKLNLGYNTDSFTNLTLGQTYNIVITADNISGEKVLYEDVITTTSVSRFLSFDIDPNYRYYDDILTVYLDYVDELDYLSDFYLSLTRVSEIEPIDEEGRGDKDYEGYEPESFTAVYALEKIKGSQDIHVSEQDMWIEPDVPYQYEFSYKRNNEKVVFKSGSVTFNTDYEGYSEVYGVYISNEADFENMTFDVYLDFIDERNILSDFVLHLDNPEFEEIAIPLEETTEKQTIFAEQYDMSFKLEYNAYLTYKMNEEEMTLTLDTVSFTDPNQPVSEFYGVIFNQKMDYSSGEFEVTLDYRDDFEYFDNFVIRFLNTEIEFDESIELSKTTEPQRILGYEYGFEPDEEYTYILSYSNNGVTTSTDPITFVFSDLYGRTTGFNRLVFTKQANFLTNEFNVQLDYTDEFGFYSEFKMHFWRNDDAFSVTIPLAANTVIQTIDGDDYGIQLREKTYNYELTCYKRGNYLTLDSGTATFIDTSGASSEYNDFIFDGTANRREDTFEVQIDYVDDFEIYSNFKLTIHDNDLGYDVVIDLEPTSEVQTFSVSDYDLFYDNSYTYTLTCVRDGVDVTLKTETFVLTDNSGMKSEVQAPSISSTANYRARSFQVTLNYQDDFDYFEDFQMTLRDTTTNNSTLINLRKTTEPQTVSFSDQHYNEDSGSFEYDIDILEHTVIYTLSYFDSSENLTVNIVENDPLPDFTNSLNTEFTSIISNWQLVEDANYAGHYCIPMKLNYIDEKGIYGYMEINMYIGDDQVGIIEFQNEVVPEVGEWIAGSVSTSLSLEDLLSHEITFKVEGQIMYEKNNNQTVDDHGLIYSTTQTLTVANNPEVLAVTSDGYVIGSDTYFYAFFSGQPGEFTNTTITIVTAENEYTYNVTLTGIGDTIYVNLTETIDGDIDYDTLVSELGEPVTIKFSYCTVTKTGSNTGPGTEVISDPIELVCYTNFYFTVSV